MNEPPNNQPHNPANPPRRQLSVEEREAARLRQEEQRLRTAQRDAKFAWVRNTVILLVGALEILLAIRFFLRLSRANLDNLFAQTIMTISDPFVSPFSTLFISPTNEDASRIFDINVLTAMFIYALLGFLAIALVNYFQGQDPYRNR